MAYYGLPVLFIEGLKLWIINSTVKFLSSKCVKIVTHPESRKSAVLKGRVPTANLLVYLGQQATSQVLSQQVRNTLIDNTK